MRQFMLYNIYIHYTAIAGIVGDGIWVFQYDLAQKRQIAQLIAGRSQINATNLLLEHKDIHQVVIHTNGGLGSALPTSPRNIRIILISMLPHARFIEMLSYKAKLVGIQVILQEESSTSKASFLDLDALPTYGKVKSEPVFSGRRVKRGMYKASDKRKINADVNGSYNIMRKAFPNVFRDNGIEDVNKMLASLVVHPERIVVPLRTRKSRIV